MIGSHAAFAEVAFPIGRRYSNKNHGRWVKRLLHIVQALSVISRSFPWFRIRGQLDSHLGILSVMVLNSDTNAGVMLLTCAWLRNAAQARAYWKQRGADDFTVASTWDQIYLFIFCDAYVYNQGLFSEALNSWQCKTFSYYSVSQQAGHTRNNNWCLRREI